MCLAIFPIEPGEAIQLEFVLERIYQRRDGGTDFWIDLLIKNTGSAQEPIKRLRVAIPYGLVELPDGKRMDGTAKEAFAAIDPLREQQANMLRVRTDQLLEPKSEPNWIYQVLHHVKIGKDPAPGGTFRIDRDASRPSVKRTVDGFIKSGWQVQVPETIRDDVWTWLLCTIHNATILDLVCTTAYKEPLQKGEAMWVRLELHLPASGYNLKRMSERWFAISREYRQVFKSPGRVLKDIRTALDNVNAGSGGSFKNYNLGTLIANAKNSALSLFPGTLAPNGIEVKDWRTFLYREYGLAFESIDPRVATLAQPHVSAEYRLPPAADPPGVRRFALPQFMQRPLAAEGRVDTAYEFQFGTDVMPNSHPDDYIIESCTKAGNAIHVYLNWLGFLIGLLGLIVGTAGLLLAIIALNR